MRRSISRAAWWGLIAASMVPMACASASSKNQQGGSDEVGNVGIALSLPGGLDLPRLDWAILDATGAVVSDSEGGASPGPVLLPDSGSASGITFQIGGVPIGDGYTIALRGTSSGGYPCSGQSTPFNVTAGGTSGAAVRVVCRVGGDSGTDPYVVTTGSLHVDASVVVEGFDTLACPAITALSGSPLRAVVGGSPVVLTAAVAGGAANVAWTQREITGTFSDPTSLSPRFTCTRVGSTTLTLTVSAPGSSLCDGQPYTTMSTSVVCESDLVPATPLDGAPYPVSCAELRGQPAGRYLLDTDGAGPAAAFSGYCYTGSLYLPPVGLCQAEAGAPPACNSFVGAVGYDFGGVDFYGRMTFVGMRDQGGQAVNGSMDALEYSNGALLTTSHDGLVRYYPVGSPGLAASNFGGNHPMGLVDLFDGRILVGVVNTVATHILSSTGTSPTVWFDTGTYWPVQSLNGTILLPSYEVSQLIQVTPGGSQSGNVTDPAFTGPPYSALQLADGTILMAVADSNWQNGRLRFFEPDFVPRNFTTAPAGMILRPDGTLSRSEFTAGGPGRMIQLPNGQIVMAVFGSNSLVRLNADGSYFDTFTMPNGISNVYGLTLDHRGRLLVGTHGNNLFYVVSFPGCSDNVRNGSETDVDCGGTTCLARCGANRTCQVGSDCVSGNCSSGFCQ